MKAYVMTFRKASQINIRACSFLPKGLAAKLWHKRCGHINCRYIQDTARKEAALGLPIEEVLSVRAVS